VDSTIADNQHTPNFRSSELCDVRSLANRVKGKLRTSFVGSLDYVMLYSPKLFLPLMNFWPTIILTCCTRKVVRSDKQHNKNCSN